MNNQVTSSPSRWQTLADQVLTGYQITREEGLEILNSSDDELLDLLSATYRMLNEEKLLEGAKAADEAKAGTYCIVASGRGPTDKEVEHVASVVEKIKSSFDLRICCCLGLLNEDQAKRLQQAGVNRINHNLNTSREYYEKICTTHTYEDRLQTLKVAREAGMELCSGLIVGMGEVPEDIVDATFELRELETRSIPVNFLNSIDGTSLVSDYLTTKGQAAEADYEMIADLGFEVIISGHEMDAIKDEPSELAAQAESC